MSNSIIKKVDDAILKAASDIQESTAYQQATEPLENLEESSRNLVGQSLGILLLIIPFSFAAYLFLQNNSLRNEYSVKLKTLTMAQDFVEKRNALNRAAGSVISSFIFNNIADVNKVIGDELDALQIDKTSIKVSGFNNSDLENSAATSVRSSNISMTFQKISLDDLTSFLNSLSRKSKFKIKNIEINKNPKTSLLEGKVSFIHFSKLKG